MLDNGTSPLCLFQKSRGAGTVNRKKKNAQCLLLKLFIVVSHGPRVLAVLRYVHAGEIMRCNSFSRSPF
jgi:hypothetical protein